MLLPVTVQRKEESLIQPRRHNQGWLAAGFAFFLLAATCQPSPPTGCTPPASPGTIANAAGNDWPSYGGGGTANLRYSSLNQIHSCNVQHLRGAWTFHAKYGEKGSSFESTPVVINGVMYLTSGRDDVWALDAKTGSVKWEYHPGVNTDKINVCCGVVNRGVAVGAGKVFVGQVDGKLVALDQQTGAKTWEVLVGAPKDGYSETMAPLFYNNMVVIGISGAEYETRGYVTAYKADDGSQVWRWYTIPAPGEPGSETWPAGSDIWKHGGGSMWMTPAVDPDLGLLYLGVGNPGPDLDGTVRKGDNLYTESIVALHVNDGTYAWHFQEVHHDIWDYDAVSPAVLFDGTINGHPVKALAQAGKTGWVYLLDRATGKPLIPIDEKAVKQDARQNTPATQPFPQGDSFVPQTPTGVGPSEKYPQGGIFTPFEELPVLEAPGANGGDEWSPITYSPQTGYVYVPGIVQPQIFTFNPSEIQQGSLKLGSGFVSPPNQNTSGTFTAIDTRSNKIAWQNKTPYMMIGGTMSTAGGLVFVGEGDGIFKAINAKTGEILWRFQTGAGANAAPMAYQVDGEEYIAIASGGNFQLNYPRGDTLWVFSLKGTMGQVAGPTPPKTKSVPATLGAAVSTDKVTIVNFGFQPANVTITKGTTVTWTNTAAFPHSATSDKKVWDTGVLQTGQSGSFTFNTPGTYTYFCKPHPFMIGQITVTG